MLPKQRIVNVLVVIATTLFIAMTAQSASAGTYVAKSCRMASNGTLPMWRHDETAGTANGTPYFFNTLDCRPSGGGIYRRFGDSGTAGGANNDWSFYAPSGTSIQQIDIRQHAAARVAGSTVGVWAQMDNNTTSALDVVNGPSSSTLEDKAYTFPNTGPKVVGFTTKLACQAGPDCSATSAGAPGAEYGLSGASITLSDPSLPVFTNVGGPGWTTAPTDGVSTITYATTDAGAGVSSVDFLVDGIVHATNSSVCVAEDPKPCPTSDSGSFALDTTGLSEGPHTITLVARDGASNATPASDKQLTITVRRPPAVSTTSPVAVTGPTGGGGTPEVGDQLNGTAGTWSGDSNSYSYQWMRCDAYGRDCQPIAGANGTSYVPVTADIGHALVFCVTATNSGGSATSCSAPTTAVVAGLTAPSGNSGSSSAALSGASPESPSSIDRGQPNGTPASDRAVISAFVNNRYRQQKVRFGKRVPISGRLMDPSGRPIAGALLQVEQQVSIIGASMSKAADVTTDRNGRFVFVAPAGPSRTIRIGYRSHTGDTDFADTTDVRLVVSAGVTVKAGPRKVRNRQVTMFTGRVLGNPVPSKGVVVDLQVLFRNKWRTFAAPRTSKAGRYKFKYRFMAGAATWKFRARVRTDSSYPYALGYSAKPIKVKVSAR